MGNLEEASVIVIGPGMWLDVGEGLDVYVDTEKGKILVTLDPIPARKDEKDADTVTYEDEGQYPDLSATQPIQDDECVDALPGGDASGESTLTVEVGRITVSGDPQSVTESIKELMGDEFAQ